MPPPSIPSAVTMASPRAETEPQRRASRFSGCPAKRVRNTSDQAMRKPQLAGASGVTGTCACISGATQLPSEPRFGQLAPPSARIVASAATSIWPSGVYPRAS